MDNLGVAMNATTIEAYALSKGIDTAYANMDNATKVGLAMEMFLEKTAYATDNYAKENETFAGSFNTLKAAVSNFLSGAGGIEDVSNTLIGFSKILIGSVGQMAPSIVEGLVSLTKTLMPQIPVLISSLMPVVLEGAIGLINGLVAIFPQLITLIQENVPTIVEGALMIMTTLINVILESLPQILDTGILVIASLIQGIAEQAPILIPQIVDTLLELFMTLTDPENLEMLAEAGVQLVLGLIEGIIRSIPVLLSDTDRLLKAMVNILSGGQALMMKIGWALIKALIKALGEMASSLKDKAGELLNKIISAFSKGISKIKDVGKNLVQGLWNGINNAKDWVLDKIKGFGKSILNGLKSFFGIKSPSRLMRDEVGKYIAEGIGVGFEDELDSVYSDMQKAIDFETEKMSANVQTGNTYNNIMNTTPVQVNGTYTSRLEVNGEVLAEVVNDVNDKKDLQYAF